MVLAYDRRSSTEPGWATAYNQDIVLRSHVDLKKICFACDLFEDKTTGMNFWSVRVGAIVPSYSSFAHRGKVGWGQRREKTLAPTGRLVARRIAPTAEWLPQMPLEKPTGAVWVEPVDPSRRGT